MKKKSLLIFLSAFLLFSFMFGAVVLVDANSANLMVFKADIAQPDEDSGSSYASDPEHRFSDGESYFIYEMTVPNNSVYAYFMARVRGNDFKIEVSNNNQNYKVVGFQGKDEKNGAVVKNNDDHYYDVSQWINENEIIYIKFSDKNTSDGNGSDLYELIYYYNQRFTSDIEMAENIVPTTVTCNLVDNANEAEYLQLNMSSDPAGELNGAGYRYFDEEKYGVYKFENLPYDALKTDLRLSIMGSYRIQVSADGESWVDRAVAPAIYATQVSDMQLEEYTIDISEFVNNNNTLYVKIGDATVNGGWGPQLNAISIDSYTPADNVEAMISNLGEITLDSKVDVMAARESYNELNEEQKALVENYDVLTAAEQEIINLENSSNNEPADDETPETRDNSIILFIILGTLACSFALVLINKEGLIKNR